MMEDLNTECEQQCAYTDDGDSALPQRAVEVSPHIINLESGRIAIAPRGAEGMQNIRKSGTFLTAARHEAVNPTTVT